MINETLPDRSFLLILLGKGFIVIGEDLLVEYIFQLLGIEVVLLELEVAGFEGLGGRDVALVVELLKVRVFHCLDYGYALFGVDREQFLQ